MIGQSYPTSLSIAKTALAPILLFVYNRPEHARKTVDALKKNDLATESDLIIFSDAAESAKEKERVDAVRGYVKGITGFASIKIIERENNFGLAKSIIDGVTSTINIYERVIVLEDDLVTSPFFLKYMNSALNFYKNFPSVASIHGYVYPIQDLPEAFFMRGADCLGWATWKEQWSEFESDGSILLERLKKEKLTYHFDINGSYPFTKMLQDQIKGRNDSWAIRWHASVFLKKKYTLYPGKSLVFNIGNDGSGTHRINEESTFPGFSLTEENIINFPVIIEENEIAFEAFRYFFEKEKSKWLSKIIFRIKSNFLNFQTKCQLDL